MDHGFDGSELVRGIGLFSLSLGAAQLAATDAVHAASGVRATPRNRWVMRGRGVTEVLQGLGVLSRRLPTGVLWSRVVGDLGDLALLGVALRDPANPRRRVLGAIGSVAVVTVADVVAARRSAAASARPAADGGRSTSAAVTVARPLDEVAARRDRVASLGEVELSTAPGERGTEVLVRLAPRNAVGRLLGASPPRRAALAQLRRFKQELETGEVVRSDGAPEGATAKRQLVQRPGQPRA